MGFTVLAIDTATELASIALYDADTGPREECTWCTLKNHTVELMPTIVMVLKRQGLEADQLNALAVSLGPGSFTGLRIGLGVAKGLCLSLGIPIVGIPTLDIVAYAHCLQDLPVCAILQAGRGRICAALYERFDTGWQRVTDYHLATTEELATHVKGPTLFCGEVDGSLRGLLQAHIGKQAVIASPASGVRRAGYLAELGCRRLQSGERDDLNSLEPLYLHHSMIGD
jgi:tRNA threonylcarbamoyladenosine biosynthesis protein TsaB